MARSWTPWNWRADPLAPRDWPEPARAIALLEPDYFAPADVRDRAHNLAAFRANATMMLTHEIVYVLPTEHPARLRLWAERYLGRDGTKALPANLVPALVVRRQADLAGVEDLCAVPAAHRALLVEPEEEIVLDEVTLRGRFIECPDETQDPETDPCLGCPGWTGPGGDHCGAIRGPHVDWVIARGTDKPVRPFWLHQLRARTKAAYLPFCFLGWGEWGVGVMTPLELSRPAVERPKMYQPGCFHDFGDGWEALRVGAESSGRELDGRTWDERPEEIG